MWLSLWPFMKHSDKKKKKWIYIFIIAPQRGFPKVTRLCCCVTLILADYSVALVRSLSSNWTFESLPPIWSTDEPSGQTFRHTEGTQKYSSKDSSGPSQLFLFPLVLSHVFLPLLPSHLILNTGWSVLWYPRLIEMIWDQLQLRSADFGSLCSWTSQS